MRHYKQSVKGRSSYKPETQVCFFKFMFGIWTLFCRHLIHRCNIRNICLELTNSINTSFACHFIPRIKFSFGDYLNTIINYLIYEKKRNSQTLGLKFLTFTLTVMPQNVITISKYPR